MRVLVACEYSGRVRDALTARGHYALSCDLLPSDTPGQHYQGDVADVINAPWDLMIAFPPCTHLSHAGGRWWAEKRKDGRQDCGISFACMLMNVPHIPRIAVENPRGRLVQVVRKPDQVIHPWQFGDPWQKATCLWLKGLPLLVPTNVVKPCGSWLNSGQASAHRRKDIERDGFTNWQVGVNTANNKRSLTFPGIALAMAEQWAREGKA